MADPWSATTGATRRVNGPRDQLPPGTPGGPGGPGQSGRNRVLAVLSLLIAAALLGYAGCQAQGDRDLAPDQPGELGQPAGPWQHGPDSPGDQRGGRAIHVAAQAQPGGDGSMSRPLPSLQAALRVAAPGETVRVAPGVYPGPVRSERSGTAEKPIWIVGDNAKIVPAPQPANKSGGDPGRLVEINHNHLVLTGFDISGGDINLWIQKSSYVRILRNNIHDARGECVRVKYFSSRNEIAFNRIERCGLKGFDVSEDEKNGEGVYIGTAPEQLKKKNPTSDPDQSNENHVHDNDIAPRAECVDVKEDARGNVVENNRCQGSEDPDGAGFSSRGIGTVFAGNTSRGHVGAGIRLGGDDDSDGQGTVVRDNRLMNNKGYGLKLNETKPESQTAICGNTVEGNAEGPTDTDDLDPARPCPI